MCMCTYIGALSNLYEEPLGTVSVRVAVAHPPLLLWSVFLGLIASSSPLSDPAATTSYACAGSRTLRPTLPLHPDCPEKQAHPWLGLKPWVQPPPHPHTRCHTAKPVSALDQDRPLLSSLHPSDSTAAEAPGVSGRWWPSGPTADRGPEEGWHSAGVQPGTWVGLAVPEPGLSPMGAEWRGVGGWDWSSGPAGGPGGERGPADTWHLSSQPDGHQHSGYHGAFSSHGRSLVVCGAQRASSEAPGLQEAPMAGQAPGPRR